MSGLVEKNYFVEVSACCCPLHGRRKKDGCMCVFADVDDEKRCCDGGHAPPCPPRLPSLEHMCTMLALCIVMLSYHDAE